MASRHPSQADRQRDRRDGRQRFGHGGHGQRDAGFEDEPERAPCNAPSAATRAATPSASQTSRRPSASRRRSSGVRFLDAADERADAAELGASRSSVTTARAVPGATVVPL